MTRRRYIYKQLIMSRTFCWVARCKGTMQNEPQESKEKMQLKRQEKERQYVKERHLFASFFLVDPLSQRRFQHFQKELVHGHARVSLDNRPEAS